MFVHFSLWLGHGFWRFLRLPQGPRSLTPTLTVGAGIQTSYDHSEPDGGASTRSFALNHLRLYFSGDITKNISAMFNTDYDSSSNKIGVLDAVGEFHSSPMFNIWFGRFLPPSDRANLYGPFYANEWACIHDGIQDGYPFVFQGRDNGVVYWGDFKAGMAKMKVVGRRVRWRFRRPGAPDVIWARSRPDRFLGSGGRLLPERHLLRRQKPARHRRSDSSSGRQDGHNRRFPAREEGA